MQLFFSFNNWRKFSKEFIVQKVAMYLWALMGLLYPYCPLSLELTFLAWDNNLSWSFTMGMFTLKYRSS